MPDSESSDQHNWAEVIRRISQEPDKANQLDPLTNEQVENSKQDRNLKKRYANGFIWILSVQLIVMNLVFIAAGVGWLKFEQWTLDIYMTGTLAEVFGLVLVITKNLFPVER
jgi:hypothetical protein